MKTLIVSLIASVVLWTVAPAQAEEPGLAQRISTKFARGVANFTLGWMELPKQVYVVGTNEGWVAGALRGPFDGLGMFVARTIAGAYEILTFPVPIPPSYGPMLRPEYVWESDPPPAPQPAPQ